MERHLFNEAPGMPIRGNLEKVENVYFHEKNKKYIKKEHVYSALHNSTHPMYCLFLFCVKGPIL